ncbi:unnamed protein product [Miscanthus lutarioriparius]|uniref:Uncharacterized protein n=1 Tax=Miscanthus lutarioriparius TaxID=422564 RepID=A0A811PZP2_9POAL|nr:unnamed protein product [Miscanthus lutarioriparius]
MAASGPNGPMYRRNVRVSLHLFTSQRTRGGKEREGGRELGFTSTGEIRSISTSGSSSKENEDAERNSRRRAPVESTAPVERDEQGLLSCAVAAGRFAVGEEAEKLFWCALRLRGEEKGNGSALRNGRILDRVGGVGR